MSTEVLAKKLGEVSTALAAIQADNARMKEAIEKKAQPDYGAAGATPQQVYGTQGPSIRKGESVMTSRPFSLCRIVGAQRGIFPWENCKVEQKVHDRLQKACIADVGPGMGMQLKQQHSTIVPFGVDYLPDHTKNEKEWAEVKSLVLAGTENADPKEMAWMRQKFYDAPGQKTAQSWLDETLGGPLVPPPEFGELIELFRNKEALVNAGAQTYPMPPQGRVIFPRQTAATVGGFIGEGVAIGLTNFQTGQLVLTPKKCAAYVQVNNELIRFANPAAEAILRSDLTKTLALTMDFFGLQGAGTDVEPLGVLNTDGVASIAASTTSANGDTFLMQDIYAIPSKVEEQNGEMSGFIMRPAAFYSLLQIRVNQGGGAATGQFGFSPFRGMNDKMTRVVNGHPATLTPQISNKRIKGNKSNLTYIVGGNWPDMILGIFGAIEFTATNLGDTAFQQDQTWVRAILFGDTGIRHPGTFAYIDNISAFAAQ